MKSGIIFNDYMHTLGGGERLTLSYATALRSLGYDVEIVTTNSVPTAQSVNRTFGTDFAEIPIRRIQSLRTFSAEYGKKIDIFVNNTYLSFAPNIGGFGIYSQMFPAKTLTAPRNKEELAALDTYDVMINLSSFVAGHTELRYGRGKYVSLVLSPPIGSAYVAAAQQCPTFIADKEKAFVSVGRFNPTFHNKNQILIAESFLEARKKYVSLRDWSLTLIGNVNDSGDANAYAERCISIAESSNGAIKLRFDCSHADLMSELRRSTGYVHATGAFLPPGEAPERCEHYGLSILEAMAFGCIPLVYGRGGIFDVAPPGECTLPYMTPAGLSEGFNTIAQMAPTDLGRSTQLACARAVRQVRQESFTDALSKIISGDMNQWKNTVAES